MLDIIIATYNRHKTVSTLISEIEKLNNVLIKNIIIVDSSDIVLQKNDVWKKTIIIHSSQKSQPFQRYLGYKNATGKYLLFLDDDMEILDVTFPNYIIQKMEQENYSALNLKFKNKNHFLENIQNKSLFSTFKTGKLIQFIRWFFGYPILKPNLFNWNGNKGVRVDNEPIEYVSGGAFVAKKKLLFKNFNAQVFDIFEKKIGMGEDSIIGYLLSKEGKVFADDKTFFYHNDNQDSTYTNSLESFHKKVFFSRWFLSKEYARINKKNSILADIFFIWYALWRLVTTLLNTIIGKYSIKIIKGQIKGLTEILKFKYKLQVYNYNE
jgi:glycosyltransferase involved in cell wall biosynthesis